MNEFSSGIIKEVLKFLTYQDVLKNKLLINKEFYCALNYNDLWDWFYKSEYADDYINRKKNDPFRELFYIRYMERKKNKYIYFPKAAQEQFLDMEASLLTLREKSTGRFEICDLGWSGRGGSNSNSAGSGSNVDNANLYLDNIPSRGNVSIDRSSYRAACWHYEGDRTLWEQLNCTDQVHPYEDVTFSGHIHDNEYTTVRDNRVCKRGEFNLNRKIQLSAEKNLEEEIDYHMCSFTQCEFEHYHKNDLYVCTESNNYHLCDDKCELAILSDIDWGYLVCPLSGKMFDDLSHSKNRRSFHNLHVSKKNRLSYVSCNTFPYVAHQDENETEDLIDYEQLQEHDQTWEYTNVFLPKRGIRSHRGEGSRICGKSVSSKNGNMCKNTQSHRVKRAHRKIYKDEKRPISGVPSCKSNLFKKIMNSYRSNRGSIAGVAKKKEKHA
ncbi:conserved Plasmodium protein, unknown function [Plasmodium ovale wallikeri]|uniref:F-box domain-containing protein n=2 Tax=Plasmodium ovale TaxID=36330 RepID=A0A1A8YY04_PLAOA|nr:conserved Plasmodium protein, unknown function [Plasmodium ovale wallikeri]SBT36462.1 conserved Plasmodium protein, unknown function [Plasmodium ovale wallikeri]SBT77420.1 conserved Plasmodium protein, unknown function [Plasmodium ovale]